MPSIRKTKTASGSTAIQAVAYKNRKTIVLKHFGSAKTKEEFDALVKDADQWLSGYAKQPSVFVLEKVKRILPLGVNRCAGIRYSCAYAVLAGTFRRIGFAALADHLLLDLVIIRIFEPSSKLRAIKLIDRYFGIRYAQRTLYRALPKLFAHKEKAEAIAVSFAERQLPSGLSFVLYDVTTLYFESFEADDLRKQGFSKDNKPAQPQIVLGLLVNIDGFPLRYEIFAGNTFEGKTMLPVLRAFRDIHKTKTCSMVADAAMLSLQNIDDLKKEGLTYIVGARIANLSPKVTDAIANALKECRDGASFRAPTPHGNLIASFSSLRYRKDKADMERQIAKAKKLVAAKESGKRAKFVASFGKTYALNHELIAKTTRLLGIKGYYTNIPQNKMGDKEIIAHYGNLWRVEQSFRMSKSDLVARPIFHHKEDSIKAHLVICFIALALGKYLEIKSGCSLRRIVDLLKQVQDARIINTRTKEENLLRALVPEEVKRMLEKLGVTY